MKVQAKTLLLLAGLVWTAAGGNILRIGLETYGPYVNWTNGLISLALFRRPVLCDHGGNDDGRHCTAHGPAGARPVHRCFLHGIGRRAFGCGAGLRHSFCTEN